MSNAVDKAVNAPGPLTRWHHRLVDDLEIRAFDPLTKTAERRHPPIRHIISKAIAIVERGEAVPDVVNDSPSTVTRPPAAVTCRRIVSASNGWPRW